MLVNCPKCNIEFENITNYNGIKKFCSRKCANAHIQTPEINQKRSLSLKGRKESESLIIKRTIRAENRKQARSIETIDLCHFGCGNQAKFMNNSGKLTCLLFSTSCPENRRKNSEKVTLAHREGRIPGWNGIPNLNRDWSKGKRRYNDSRIGGKYDSNLIFSYKGKGPQKEIIIQERGYKCEICGISEWLGNPLPLEMDHIDGDYENNVRENLRLLCSNCHSQTPTWKGRNKSKVQKVSDEILTLALKEESSICKALYRVGLTPKGPNYKRCYKLLYKA